MRTIGVVLQSIWKRQTLDKKKFILMFLFPVLSIVISILIGNIDNKDLNLAVINEIKTAESNQIIQLMDKTNGIALNNVSMSEGKIGVITGKYDAYIVFSGSNISDIQNITDNILIYNIKDKKINDELYNLIELYSQTHTVLDFNNRIAESDSADNHSVISFLFVILLITSVMNSAIIIKDREENIIPRYLYSPNRISQYTLGVTAYNFIMSILQSVFALVIASILGAVENMGVIQIIFYSCFLSLLTTTLAVFIISLFKRELLANMMAATISLILALLGGAFIPYDKMPEALQIICKGTPNYWVIRLEEWLKNCYTGFNPFIILCGFIVVFVGLTIITMKKMKQSFN